MAWDANSEPDLDGYKLYYKQGPSGEPYNGTGAEEGNSPITVFLEDLVDPDSPTYSLNGLEDGQQYSFTATAFNTERLESGFSNAVSITIEAALENQMPVADSGPDQSVAEGETVVLTGLDSSDPDDAISEYHWTQTAGPVVELSGAQTAQSAFIAPIVSREGATLSFRVTVTDSGGLTASDSCNVNVTWLNDPPTVLSSILPVSFLHLKLKICQTNLQ